MLPLSPSSGLACLLDCHSFFPHISPPWAASIASFPVHIVTLSSSYMLVTSAQHLLPSGLLGFLADSCHGTVS